MSTSPVISWNSATSPYSALSSQVFTGTGFSGAIVAGSTSTAVTVRLYNNFAGASGIADALNCVLAVYDNAVTQGQGITPPTIGLYVQVEVLDYNGATGGADSGYFPIGGLTKHPIPVNSGTIGGTGTNYVEISVQIVVPSTATQGAVSQGLWVEYSSTS